MTIWALADLHLALSVPDKKMDFFGEPWTNYTDKIAANWRSMVAANDLVLLPGDISWAMHLEDARIDLEWIDQLPGTKLMLRGNHDYWWSSLSKVQKILPPSMHVLQNNVFHWNDVTIAGARLWDTAEYGFHQYIEYKANPREKVLITTHDDNADEAERIFLRELQRLELSLKCLEKNSRPIRLAMTHYPPIGADLNPSRASRLLEQYNIQSCVFGHLHNIKKDVPLFGEKNGVRYLLTSCDYLNFSPLKVM